MKTNKNFSNTTKFVLIVLTIWVAITSGIYRAKNQSKTETEVLFHVPKSFIFDFDD